MCWIIPGFGTTLFFSSAQLKLPAQHTAGAFACQSVFVQAINTSIFEGGVVILQESWFDAVWSVWLPKCTVSPQSFLYKICPLKDSSKREQVLATVPFMPQHEYRKSFMLCLIKNWYVKKKTDIFMRFVSVPPSGGDTHGRTNICKM